MSGTKVSLDRQAFLEAEAYKGPSLIIAYAHCIAHGCAMTHSLGQQKLAVQSGYWLLFRFNPALAAQGKNPFQMDSRPPSIPLEQYIYNETRYTSLTQSHPEEAKHLLEQAKQDVLDQWKLYRMWASMPLTDNVEPTAASKGEGE